MYHVPGRLSSDSKSDLRRNLWSDRRFGNRWRRRPDRRPRRYLLYAGLLVGFCVLLAFAGCGSTVGVGELKAAVSGVNFGAVLVGQVSTETLTFSNTGTGAVDVSGVTVTGPSFRFVGPDSFPVTVAAGSTYSFRVQFSPSTAGNATGQVTVDSNVSAGGLPTVSISGLGVQASAAAAVAGLSGIACSNSSMVGAGTDNCSVALSAPAESGGLSVSLTSNNAAVKVPATVTVPANTSEVGFTATVATVASAESATLTASANGTTESFALELDATGAFLSASQTSLAFGDVSLNSPGKQTLTLTSAGTLPVTVNTAVLTGVGFSLSGTTLPVVLNPGQSLALQLEFIPSILGAAAGQLTIGSNATDDGTLVIALTGTGATPYQLDLNWDPPAASTDPVAGYRVYRSLNSVSSYLLLNSAVNLTTTFTDTTVQNGQAYVYYVTSVDASGVESAPSNSFDVTIP